MNQAVPRFLLALLVPLVCLYALAALAADGAPHRQLRIDRECGFAPPAIGSWSQVSADLADR